MFPRPPNSTLSLHDALPILLLFQSSPSWARRSFTSGMDSARLSSELRRVTMSLGVPAATNTAVQVRSRSEEHTSELQSQSNLVCRLLLEKKNKHMDLMQTST